MGGCPPLEGPHLILWTSIFLTSPQPTPSRPPSQWPPSRSSAHRFLWRTCPPIELDLSSSPTPCHHCARSPPWPHLKTFHFLCFPCCSQSRMCSRPSPLTCSSAATLPGLADRWDAWRKSRPCSLGRLSLPARRCATTLSVDPRSRATT